VLISVCELSGVVIVVVRTIELVDDASNAELEIAVLEFGRVVNSVEVVKPVLKLEIVEIVLSTLLCNPLLVVVTTVVLESSLDGSDVAVGSTLLLITDVCEVERVVLTLVGRVESTGLVVLSTPEVGTVENSLVDSVGLTTLVLPCESDVCEFGSVVVILPDGAVGLTSLVVKLVTTAELVL